MTTDADVLDLARQVRANRLERERLARDAAETFARLAPGGIASFALPLDNPARRDCYKAIQNVAHRTLGVGRYSLESLPGCVVVQRHDR